jgi:hypothetical protein
MSTVEKPLSIVIVYTLALAAVYTASYRGLTVRALQSGADDRNTSRGYNLRTMTRRRN